MSTQLLGTPNLSFNLNFPTSKGARLTVFGMGGISRNTLDPGKDTTAWEFEKEGYNIIYKNKMGAVGATYDQPLGRKASIRTVLVAGKISLNTTLTHRVSARERFKSGVFLTTQKYRTPPVGPGGDVKSWLVQPFVSWSLQFAPSLTSEIGLHGMISKVEEGIKPGSIVVWTRERR
ncbi:hypothetical protein LZD49_09850 [Dyadobacter sp. CY261]|uniref:hypothetical protein n=1 Tax=Dyadobacter sp. CY261 TaxID=2907203 RepID=UPI001F16ABC9|nr:hypothetical protein [Dyadobacter sp. CY261]MCF0070776.1 hypothetical protein [Dyadobacter sp. CY261]